MHSITTSSFLTVYMSQNLSFSINQTPFVPQQQVFLTNILAHAVWCVLCLLVDCQKGHNLGVPTFANNYRVSQKTHFQNHHPASWHPREIKFKTSWIWSLWGVSLQDDDSESAFFWDTLHIIHKILEASISENNQIKFLIFTDRNILAWGGAVGGQIHWILLGTSTLHCTPAVTYRRRSLF